jgi:hypothetical protein
MIIVSQDKKRTTESMELFIDMIIGDNEPVVYGIYADKSNSYLNLGIYKTEERAKEILIEIAREFRRVLRTENRGTGQQRFYDVPKVYYMPEK